MHNGEQVGVDSTSPLLREFGYVHVDPSMGQGHQLYEGDSVYDRKALTDTEYAAYLIDFTRRVLGLTTEEASQIVSPITGLDLEAMDEERQRLFRLLSLNYVQLTPTGPYKFTIVESRPAGEDDGRRSRRRHAAGGASRRLPREHGHQVPASARARGQHRHGRGRRTGGANGSEAKIADAMLRSLHHQGVLKDAGHDLRFNMRPGGNPGRGEYGGVVEAFLTPGDGTSTSSTGSARSCRCGVPGRRRTSRGRWPRTRWTRAWRAEVSALLDELAAALPEALAAASLETMEERLASIAPLPRSRRRPARTGLRLVAPTLERLSELTGDAYRWLCELALPSFAARGDAERAAALRVLAELRKRVAFCDLGGKALSTIEYLTDGGRAADGSPEGGSSACSTPSR